MPSTVELFRQFPNRLFVETGTYHGDGAKHALDAGFSAVVSIELGKALYEENVARFSRYKSVTLHQGDSAECLAKIMAWLNYPATFWLDAHHSGGETAWGKDRTPILRELAEIAKHHIKTHSILIDDVRLLNTEEFDNISLGQVAEALWRINPAYVLRRHVGHVPFDVLSANIPPTQ